MSRGILTLLILSTFALTPARADFLIRIGDIDGFGYGTAPGFLAGNGGPANVDGVGVLSSGDFLPDINMNGSIAAPSNDEFDFRSADEIANTAHAVNLGVSNSAATVGAKFTDISLSTAYDARSAAGQVLIGGNPQSGLIRGAGGPFPAPPSSTLPNQPGFLFAFDVDKSAIDSGTPIFFNLIFGDYDIRPAGILITQSDGTSRLLELMQQSNQAGGDGSIQAATATLAFGEVFSDAGDVWRGKLNVDFLAPREPYTAFDYVELSTTALVPEPTAAALLGIGLLGLLAYGWRRRADRAAGV